MVFDRALFWCSDCAKTHRNPGIQVARYARIPVSVSCDGLEVFAVAIAGGCGLMAHIQLLPMDPAFFAVFVAVVVCAQDLQILDFVRTTSPARVLVVDL